MLQIAPDADPLIEVEYGNCHNGGEKLMSALGQKRTLGKWAGEPSDGVKVMSAYGQKRTFRATLVCSR